MTRVWGSLFDKAAIARGGHLLAGPLAKPRAIELLWYPDIGGRLGHIQRAKTRSQHRGLHEERQNTMEMCSNAKTCDVVVLVILKSEHNMYTSEILASLRGKLSFLWTKPSRSALLRQVGVN